LTAKFSHFRNDDVEVLIFNDFQDPLSFKDLQGSVATLYYMACHEI